MAVTWYEDLGVLSFVRLTGSILIVSVLQLVFDIAKSEMKRFKPLLPDPKTLL